MDYSSYESHPLGRTEWVKLYGLLTGQQEAAESAFNAEKQAFESVSGAQPTGKTVAFFYITTNGKANVRRPSDYLAKMIEMAGGTYILEQDPDDESKSSTMSMEMEAFYAQAKDADYIIYARLPTISGWTSWSNSFSTRCIGWPASPMSTKTTLSRRWWAVPQRWPKMTGRENSGN